MDSGHKQTGMFCGKSHMLESKKEFVEGNILNTLTRLNRLIYNFFNIIFEWKVPL